MKNYFLNLLIALDENLNTIAGGYPDETISLRAALAKDRGALWGCVLCRVLDWFQKDHCAIVEADRRQSDIERKL